MKPSPMAGWRFSNHESKALDDNNFITGIMLSHKPHGIELLHICDLPPPIKVFSGSNNAVSAALNRIYSLMSRKVEEDVLCTSRNSSTENERFDLLKALRLPQMGARDAETKHAAIVKETDSLLHAVLMEPI
ncbi:hypothetical protein Nepgr_016496 [Nepenthes gracilis]|uniref:Uncharacterized protein n=1 Tax=Nepenthes gracilis TaxID=150966 RepID=A0AAD3XSJ8_NEPGR|nr:hypothetical protein Nepgr_016496 [Nepenthes gracilis]